MTDADLTKHLAAVGVPDLYLTWRLKDFACKVPPINESGLFITGPNGTGKTSLAAAILADKLPGLWRTTEVATWDPREGKYGPPWDKYSYNAAFITVADLLKRLKRTFEKDAELTEGQILDDIIEHWLLVLDDLGAEHSTEWALSTLHIVLSERINERRPTIVTSNLSIAEIKIYDPRTGSRLSGMTQYDLGGPDRREKRP